MKGDKHPKIALDGINNFPADIISFILSLLTLKEAARTSILSCRWRYMWKTCVAYSSSLNLDVLAMRSCSFPHNEFGDCIAGRNYYCLSMPRRRTQFKRHKFVGYSYQILHLDHNTVKDSLRHRFYMVEEFAHPNDQWVHMAIAQIKDFTDHINQWINMALAKEKKAKKCHNGLSHLVIRREIYYDGSLFYQFPCLFSTQEKGSSRKYLKSCSVKFCNSNGYSSLIDLRLKQVFVDRNTLVSILSDCPNLEKLYLSMCKGLVSLKISGPSIKLKDLTIYKCKDLKNIEINDTILTRFQYNGFRVKFVSMNVPQLSSVVFRTEYDRSYDALHYAFGKLSSDFPQLESLMFSVGPIEGKEIPRQLPVFSNLKNLILLVDTFGGKLWVLVPLLQASPNLQRLEVNLNVLEDWERESYVPDMESEQGQMDVWEDLDIEIELGLMESTSEFLHLHLEEIILSGFRGFSHEIHFAAHFLKNATTLKRLTILSRTRGYDAQPNMLMGPENEKFETLAEKITSKEKKTEDSWEQLGKYLRPGVELLFA